MKTLPGEVRDKAPPSLLLLHMFSFYKREREAAACQVFSSSLHCLSFSTWAFLLSPTIIHHHWPFLRGSRERYTSLTQNLHVVSRLLIITVISSLSLICLYHFAAMPAFLTGGLVAALRAYTWAADARLPVSRRDIVTGYLLGERHEPLFTYGERIASFSLWAIIIYVTLLSSFLSSSQRIYLYAFLFSAFDTYYILPPLFCMHFLLIDGYLEKKHIYSCCSLIFSFSSSFLFMLALYAFSRWRDDAWS